MLIKYILNIQVDLDDDLTSVQKNATTSILEIGKKLLHCAREGNSQGVIDLLGKGAPITADWVFIFYFVY